MRKLLIVMLIVAAGAAAAVAEMEDYFPNLKEIQEFKINRPLVIKTAFRYILAQRRKEFLERYEPDHPVIYSIYSKTKKYKFIIVCFRPKNDFGTAIVNLMIKNDQLVTVDWVLGGTDFVKEEIYSIRKFDGPHPWNMD